MAGEMKRELVARRRNQILRIARGLRSLLAAMTALLRSLALLALVSCARAASSTLRAGASLAPGTHITAGAGFLVADAATGDLCVSAKLNAAGDGCAAPVLYSAGVRGHAGAFVFMAEYGVLEIRPKGCTTQACRLWQSHTMGAFGCTGKSQDCAFLQMQKDGNAVLRGGTPAAPKGGQPPWATQTKILPADAKNVLHIIADDLRPEMKLAYGQQHMITPAFDRLAREGIVFDRAYCQIAVCSPSRNSFMSWLR